MLTIRSILAPTEFGGHSRESLRYAVGMAERFGATLHLLHVLPEVVPAGPDVMIAPALPPEYYTESEAESLAALPGVLDPAWGKPPALETAVRWGEAVDGVVEYARAHAIDLIVVATHGRHGLSHALLGSAAERIVRDAPCPVLTIRDTHV
jgi:universal stress protein A